MAFSTVNIHWYWKDRIEQYITNYIRIIGSTYTYIYVYAIKLKFYCKLLIFPETDVHDVTVLLPGSAGIVSDRDTFLVTNQNLKNPNPGTIEEKRRFLKRR